MIRDANTHLNIVIAKTGPVLVPTPRWVRALIGDTFVADSKRVTLVREPGTLPVFAFPRADVREDLLIPSGSRRPSPILGPVTDYTIQIDNVRLDNAAWIWSALAPEHAALADHVALRWEAIDHWYEEAEEIFRHPRDPFHRVDAIGSQRHVRVIHAGEVIAESRRPRLLFETGHPVRYYLPTEDIRMDFIQPTVSVSRCPYKGVASYWSIKSDDTHRDIAWAYLDPILECPSIRGLISFYNERIDTIEVDGEAIARPQTSGL
ncbi:MAG: DUF427 domain-containing protein [Chloroflexota bacterium]